MPGIQTYTPDEAAQRLKVSAITVRRWIRQGWLPAANLRGRYRVTTEDLAEFLRAAGAKQPQRDRAPARLEKAFDSLC